MKNVLTALLAVYLYLPLMGADGKGAGSVLWGWRKSDGGILSSPAIGPDGTIYVGCGDRKIYAISSPSPVMSSGTGFFITNDGFLMTNYHVVDGATQITVIGGDKKKFKAKVIRVDKQNDLAVLKVEGKFSALPIVSSRTIGLGESVFTVGYPQIDVQGISAKYTRGNISSLSGVRDDPRNFQISVPIQPGNSGGPLVDEYGNVCGIVVSRLDAIKLLIEKGTLPQNVNYAVKSSIANSFLESMPNVVNKLLKPNSRSQTRKSSDVVQKVQSATALILANKPIAQAKLPERQGRIRWVFNTGDKVYSSPAIGSDGTVYIGSWDKKFYALDGKTGRKKWEYKADGEFGISPAIGADGTVYVISSNKKIHAINGKTGVQEWGLKLRWQSDRQPVIGADGTVFIEQNQFVYALNGKTGAKKWEFFKNDHEWFFSNLAIGPDQGVYVGDMDGKVYALNHKDGSKKWEFNGPANLAVHCITIGTDGTIYATLGLTLFALDGNTGKIKWKTDKTTFVNETAIGNDGTIMGFWSNNICAFDCKTGAKKWLIQSDLLEGSADVSPLIDTTGNLYFCRNQGINGSSLFAMKTSSDGSASNAWPMRGMNVRRTGRVTKK